MDQEELVSRDPGRHHRETILLYSFTQRCSSFFGGGRRGQGISSSAQVSVLRYLSWCSGIWLSGQGPLW